MKKVLTIFLLFVFAKTMTAQTQERKISVTDNIAYRTDVGPSTVLDLAEPLFGPQHDWQLKGKQEHKRIFIDGDLTGYDNWTIQHKNFVQDKDFVKGADVGFLTMQEKRGVVFHDRNGRERECLELLKNDYQISAIRMRVWVNPRDGDCDKFALLAMAKRVKALGMDLMVDFHYSDWWADPAKQPIPKAWLGHTFEEMKQDVRNHTLMPSSSCIWTAVTYRTSMTTTSIRS